MTFAKSDVAAEPVWFHRIEFKYTFSAEPAVIRTDEKTNPVVPTCFDCELFGSNGPRAMLTSPIVSDVFIVIPFPVIGNEPFTFAEPASTETTAKRMISPATDTDDAARFPPIVIVREVPALTINFSVKFA